MDDLVKSARTALTRAELPGMSLIEHLEELRKRVIHSAVYLVIGFAQCLAMIPGVSRSGASIVAAMLLGADKRAAAEFSFFLAIPTMIGAFAYDFYKNRGEMTSDHLGTVAIGFVVSFVVAIVVVKTFLNYVTRRGFTLFAWWRVIVGTLGLIALAMGR